MIIDELKKQRMDFRKMAMRDKESVTAKVGKELLTTLIGELDTAAMAKDLSDADVIKKIKSYIVNAEENKKMGMDSDRCECEIDLLNCFLPRQLSVQELTTAITAAITEVNATSMQDMGKVMGKLKENHAGLFDGGQASGIIKNLLTSK